jgi:nitrogen fixation protein FixH
MVNIGRVATRTADRNGDEAGHLGIGSDMTESPAHAKSDKDSAWRLFPWAIVAGMGIVVAVNATMVWAALDTFPGKAGRDGFELSNRYNAVLARVEEQAALGWTVQARVDDLHRPILTLLGASGAPLTGAMIEATAQRPLGDDREQPLDFQEAGAGRYIAVSPLASLGQWDLALTATANGHALTTTLRVVAR